MQIYYFGHSYFYFKGENFSIALDPFKDVGLKEIKVKADYVFCSHQHFDHNNYSIVSGAKEVENSPIFNIVSAFHDENGGLLRGKNDILIFKLDGFKIAFMGDYGEYFNLEIESKLNGVDILLLPIGGKYTIDSDEAFNLISRVKPKTVIPMHYKVENSKIDVATSEEFLKKVKNYKVYNSPYDYIREDEGVVVLNLYKGVNV